MMTMVTPLSQQQQHRKHGGIYVSHRSLCFLILASGCVLMLQFRATLLQEQQTTSVAHRSTTSLIMAMQPRPAVNSVSSLRATYHYTRFTANDTAEQCQFYLAESAIPQGGLGIFVGGQGLLKGDVIGFPDICIYVPDMDNDKVKDWMHMRTHTWGRGNFFGQFEGLHNRAACEGVVTTFNTMPDSMVNSKIVSLQVPTNAGLHRASEPGAGAITHHFGIHAEALDVVSAGSELTVYYGDFAFDPNKSYVKPQRDPKWLAEHGWCIDNIEIRPATDPSMGRGAFVKRAMEFGQVVAPAPMQLFPDRSVFQDTIPEQLFINYCFQPRNSNMVLYPYGQGVNLINHSRQHANVFLRWSSKSTNHLSWLDMSVDQLFRLAKPGGLILEVVALRPIAAGEELFLDYGEEWEDAWNEHISNWRPVSGADKYVYPAEMDESVQLLTMAEQKAQPYADNLITMCVVSDKRRASKNEPIVWREPDRDWWRSLAFCHILDREMGPSGEYVYIISALLDYRTYRKETTLEYNENIPLEQLYIETGVPRRAIRFVEKPYKDDEHLLNAFRHPIGFPDELTPDAWKVDL